MDMCESERNVTMREYMMPDDNLDYCRTKNIQNDGYRFT